MSVSKLIDKRFLFLLGCCPVTQSCVTLWLHGQQHTRLTLSFIISWSLLKLMPIESVMPSNRLILCCLFLLPSIFPSNSVFTSESALGIRWTKYWSFSFLISPSNEYSGLISFGINRFDSLAAQGTLRSILCTTIWQHQFFSIHPFMVQLLHLCMTTGKTILWLYRSLFAKWCLCFLIC